MSVIMCVRCGDGQDRKHLAYFALTMASAAVDYAESHKDVDISDGFICKICIETVLPYLLQVDTEEYRHSLHKLQRVPFTSGLPMVSDTK